jgi:hypothetical protein
MIKQVLLVLFVGVIFCIDAQDDLDYSWHKEYDYKIGERETWSVDGLLNVYISNKTAIEKYDSIGVLKFSQSIKSLGKMTQLVPINTMKLVHFSEEQQTLCYLDNTLSFLDDCIELSERNIMNATLISASNQPDKLWVLDNLNSRLLLIPLEGNDQYQEIMNTKGILAMDHITQIAERGNNLLVLDPEIGVYVFDMYGSLITTIPIKNVKGIDANNRSVFLLTNDKLIIWSLDNDSSMEIDLPVANIDEFRYKNHRLFLRSSKTVHKFRLQFSE